MNPPANLASAKRSVVALSGGVDSSLCAWLLKERGEDFDAVYMRNWKEDEGESDCSADADIAVLKQVCLKLGARLRLLDLSEEYWHRVFNDYLQQLQSGLTPNPDVFCNQQIKFGALMERIRSSGYERLVTGHYARIVSGEHGPELHRAADASKDQSYFLYLVNQDMLRHSHFPLGDWLKDDVRLAARSAGLVNHDRRDSTGICFIGERPFRAFMREYIKVNDGEIRHLDDDRLLGSHQGACLYTIGQRQGLGIGGQSGGGGGAWYVASKDIASNIVYVVQNRHHPALYRRQLTVKDLHWIGHPPTTAQDYACQLRYRQDGQACHLHHLNDSSCTVELHEAAFAVTPGQAFVLYNGTHCLGGGTIATA
ncbi:MAG: tRNA 2-thiouridine(34) synthase MnmA [Gammaproteobacteria bacterium]|nr:tRNA 2-thiouridine(34) synthase MnmA [Gammaproteobacteria bacterium]